MIGRQICSFNNTATRININTKLDKLSVLILLLFIVIARKTTDHSRPLLRLAADGSYTNFHLPNPTARQAKCWCAQSSLHSLTHPRKQRHPQHVRVWPNSATGPATYIARGAHYTLFPSASRRLVENSQDARHKRPRKSTPLWRTLTDTWR